MIGEKSNPKAKDFDRYRCFNCGTTIEYGSKRPECDRKNKR